METKPRILKKIAHWLLLSGLLFGLADCKSDGPGKRVTTVTGQVLDEAQQPVDSVLIFMSSVGFVKPGITLGETYTNEEGKYEIRVDVPKGYQNTSVGIDFNHDLNFSLKYRDYSYSQSGASQGVCCPVAIGSKTSYDFILLFK